MSTNLELIQSLIEQAAEMSYFNDKLDSVKKRAEMIIRKIFGDTTHYLKSLHNIRFLPRANSSSITVSSDLMSFNKGKNQLLILLKVAAEELQIDDVAPEPMNLINQILPISNKVFIVHGHNEEMKQTVARLISKLKLNPIILHEQPSKGKTIIEKFSDNSDVVFAIVLISADDFAYAKNDKEENGKYRARQNVIFELGYFIGKLGRERVLTLFETENDIEILSDYTGVLFVPYDNLGKWQLDIVKELKAIGISVDANDIF